MLFIHDNKFLIKMWLVIFYIGLQIVQNYAFFNNPELLSSYPLRTEYSKFLSDSDTDIDEKCPGFQCNSSGLIPVQINDIISKENEIRDSYARERNITNIYSVHWNQLLADHAQERSYLSCLLPATGNSVIYEHVTNQWFPENITLWNKQSNHSLKDWPTAVETVIGSRTFARKDRVDLQHTISEFIEVFNKIDNISNPLERRGGTVDMGCSYLVTANATHNTDYMVCLYGFLYFDPNTTANKYNNEIGTPCSRCTFYSNFKGMSETRGQQWTCGTRFPHTCTNLSKRQTYDNSVMNPSQFDCERKLTNKLKKPFLPSNHGLLDIKTSKPIAKIYSSNESSGSERVFISSEVLIMLSIITVFRFICDKNY